MKILHLVHRSWPYHGGAERYVLEHALAGKRWGHESTIFTTDAWDMSWLTSRKGNHLPLGTDCFHEVVIKRFGIKHPPFQNLVRALLRRIKPCGADRFFYPNPFIPSMRKTLDRENTFDLVHANALPSLLYLGYRYASRRSTGLVSVPHANVGEKFRRVKAVRYFEGCQPEILRNSSFVVAQSRFEASLYVEMGVPDERILVLGSGIDPDEFRTANGQRCRQKMGIGKDPVVLLLTGQCLDKGSLLLLETCCSLWEQGRKFNLVLAGPVMNDFRMELDRISSERTGSRLIVTGYIEQKDRMDLLDCADIIVLPSRLDCFGIVVLEAWVVGKPVIGCWSGAMPDMIDDGKNGFIIPFGDQATLAHRIGVLIDLPELGQKMGELGREYVFRERTWDKVTDRFYSRLSETGISGL